MILAIKHRCLGSGFFLKYTGLTDKISYLAYLLTATVRLQYYKKKKVFSIHNILLNNKTFKDENKKCIVLLKVRKNNSSTIIFTEKLK